jgi:hypothetical protein
VWEGEEGFQCFPFNSFSAKIWAFFLSFVYDLLFKLPSCMLLSGKTVVYCSERQEGYDIIL